MSKSASVVVTTQTHDLNQIEEEQRFDPDEKEPVISKPSSVDTGLHEISRLKRKKGMRRKKTRSSQSINPDELQPLHLPEPQTEPVSDEPVEPSVVILRPKEPKFEQNQDTSNSCTIRKDQCRSDPERLSVSDNKLQVGELTENLKRTHGRRNMNRTLKSVLSESSVVDPDSQRRIHSDGPKSAENVNDDHPESNLRAKSSNQDEQKDELFLEQMIEKWETDIDQMKHLTEHKEDLEDDSWKTISADTTPFSSSQASRGRQEQQARDQIVQSFLRLAQMNENMESSSTGELNPVEQLVRDVLRSNVESRRNQSLRHYMPNSSSRPGTSRTRSFSSTSNTAELIQSIVIDEQHTNTANLSQSICRSSRPMSGNSAAEEDAVNQVNQALNGTFFSSYFQECYPQAEHAYYEIELCKAKFRLYYTPRQLTELMHEVKCLSEVFVSSIMAALVAGMTALTAATVIGVLFIDF